MNFFAKYKKILLIIGFVIISVGLAYLLWAPVLNPEPIGGPDGQEPGTIIGPGGLPETGIGDGPFIIGEGGRLEPIGDREQPVGPDQPSGPGGIIGGQESSPVAVGGLTQTELIISQPTFSPKLDSNGNLNYYNLADNKFYKLDSNGNLVALSEKTFPNVVDVTWAPNTDKAVMEFPDSSKIIYNFDTEKQVTLPKHWDDFSFSPEGNQLSAKSLGIDPDNRWLIVFSDDGSQAKTIEDIGLNDSKVYVDWSPNNQTIATWTKGIDFNRQEVFFVGLNGENFKSTIIEGRGLQSTWSTTGDKLLYSVYSSDNEMNPRLWIVDAQGESIGQDRQSLDLNTWAEKCTFASNNDIYCAVPESLPTGAGLFPELADTTRDYLYHIDLSTGSKNMIAIPDKDLNISQVMVSPDQKFLYFTDSRTGQVHQINLR